MIRLFIQFILLAVLAPMTHRAVRWYHLAAEQGHPDVQVILGSMYENGRNVPEDIIRACAWFNIAAAQGVQTDEKWKNELLKRMTRNQTAEVQKLSSEYREAYGPGRLNNIRSYP